MYNDDNRFNLYLAQITDAFHKNPGSTKEIINVYLDSVDYSRKDKNKITIGKYVDILLLVIVCAGILALGLFNIENYGMYLFGFVFFLAGTLIGNFVPGFGIIFLISHGMSGFWLMISALDVENYSTFLSDAPAFSRPLLSIILIVLFGFGIFFTIIHSLGKLKGKKYGICYSFICFFLLFLILAMIPEIVKFLNWVL